MASKLATWAATLGAMDVLALPSRAVAHDVHYSYVLFELGTVGGPQSFMVGLQIVLNNRGMVVGNVDTAVPEPNFNPLVHFCQDPVEQHAFVWQRPNLPIHAKGTTPCND